MHQLPYGRRSGVILDSDDRKLLPLVEDRMGKVSPTADVLVGRFVGIRIYYNIYAHTH